MNSIKRNFIYNSIYQIYAIIVPLITTPYLSRVLKPEGIGQYAYAYAVAHYFGLFIKLGLNSYGNRTIATVRDNKVLLSSTFWNIYMIQMSTGIVAVLVYVVYVGRFAENRIVALTQVLYILSVCLDITWFFYGLEEFKTTALRDIGVKTITLIGIFMFVKSMNDVWKYALILSLGSLISQIILWPGLIRKIWIVRPEVNKIRTHIKPTLILFLPTIAVSLYKTMDKIMLGKMAGKIEVGYYESCEKMIQVPMAIITSLGIVMLPHMSNMYASEKEDSKRAISIIRKSEHIMMIFASVMGFGIMAVAKEFVPLFYGKGFEKCVYLFYILLPSCIFLAFANVIRTQYLIPKKYDKEFVVSLFCGAIVNLSINLVLIPRIQSVGAAIGTLFAEITVCLVQVMYVRKQLHIIKIFFECGGYIVIAFLMFLIGKNIPIEVGDQFVQIVLKVIICGSFWMITMVLHFLFVKNFRIKNGHEKRRIR